MRIHINLRLKFLIGALNIMGLWVYLGGMVLASDGGSDVSSSVIVKSLDSNLSYLFAVYAIAWLSFFAYLFYVNRRQRELDKEIKILQGSANESST